MSERQALLIGVPKYPARPDLDLKVVYRDIADLQTALEGCGYKVHVRGTSDTTEVTRNSIRRFIRESCIHASPGGTLIICFSGHGINFRGKDLLLPCDADLAAEDLANTLVIADISEMVAQSKAATIAFFIDACREGVDWGTKAPELMRLTGQEYRTLREKCFVTVFACSEGQESQYLAGDNGFSLFTHALSEVLSPQNPARTLHEVLTSTQRELDRLVKQFGKRPQIISWKGEESLEKEWRRRIVSDSRGSSDTGGDARNWSIVADESTLWGMLPGDGGDGSLHLTRQATSDTAAQAQAVFRQGTKALPNDPWSDETYPVRVVNQLELLVQQTEGLELNPVEIALLISAPFVREAVYAAAVSNVAASSPLEILEETVGKSEHRRFESVIGIDASIAIRRKLTLAQRVRPRLVRAAVRLREGKPPQAQKADAIALWIMHEFIMREPSFWQSLPAMLQSRPVTSPPSDESQAHIVSHVFATSRLLALSKCVGCEPTRIELVDTAFPLQPVAVLIAGDSRVEVREQLIGFLLAVAGWMALDVRQMPELVADHVAADTSMSPIDLVQTLQTARWRPMGTTRQLEATCGHQAIDYALRDYVRRSNEGLQFVRERAARVAHLESLNDLPSRLGDGDVRALQLGRGMRAYELPHISFTLDPDQIREMLMGQQLYGEPELAIRELYQNALDACRYRQARLDYLKRRSECPPEHLRWRGVIQFVHGTTTSGREYLECCDNGVGMGKLELAECFAKAGQRFRDLPEFLEEQELWFGCDPPIRMYPNSQFGIGVFSYFMLADELEIDTCRLDRLGRLGHRLLAHISASGKLFRIQDLGSGAHPGTRLRLYLKENHEEGFLSNTLLKQLRIAEFATEVSDGTRTHSWNPLEPAESSPTGDPNVWWAPTGGGELLSDGLRVEEANDDKWVQNCGLIINLTGEHLPRLTVDRKKMLDWDSSWARSAVENCLPSLAKSASLSMAQLWIIQREFGSTFESVLKPLAESATPIPIGAPILPELFSGGGYYGPTHEGLSNNRVSYANVRPDRLGIDARDIGLLALHNLKEPTAILASTGWIESAETLWFPDDDERTDFTPSDVAIKIHDALHEHRTYVVFRQRLSALIAEGLDIHPIAQAIVGPPSAADYRAYRQNLRRYRLGLVRRRMRAVPRDLRINWKEALLFLGAMVVLELLVVGLIGLFQKAFRRYPRETTFAIVTGFALFMFGSLAYGARLLVRRKWFKMEFRAWLKKQ